VTRCGWAAASPLPRADIIKCGVNSNMPHGQKSVLTKTVPSLLGRETRCGFFALRGMSSPAAQRPAGVLSVKYRRIYRDSRDCRNFSPGERTLSLFFACYLQAGGFDCPLRLRHETKPGRISDRRANEPATRRRISIERPRREQWRAPSPRPASTPRKGRADNFSLDINCVTAT
jgi:hypothetical protein